MARKEGTDGEKREQIIVAAMERSCIGECFGSWEYNLIKL